MDTVKERCGKFLGFLAVLLLLSMSGAATVQDQAAPAKEQQDQNQDQTQRQSDKPALSRAEGSVRPAQAPPTHDSPSREQKPAGEDASATKTSQEKEVKITPREAEELFHSVDEILAFDSKQSGLPIKRAGQAPPHQPR